MSNILKNMHNERVAFDGACIVALRNSRGETRTREIIEEVVFHLTARLELLRRARDAGDAAQARALAGRIAAAADQVGLVGFARVARDLGACLAASDALAAVAAPAVAARLERMADRSICRLLDHADRTAL